MKRTLRIAVLTLAAAALITAQIRAQVTGGGQIGPTAGGGGTTFTGGTLSTATSLNDDLCFTIGSSDAATDPCIRHDTTQTVDTGMLLTGSTSNHWVIAERADEAFDFAHAQQTNPTLFIHSANQSTTQWMGLSHDGTNGVISTGTGVVSSSYFSGTSGFQVGTNGQLYNASSGAGGGYFAPLMNTATPDASFVTAGSTSNSVHFSESGDFAFDFNNGPCGTGACTNPQYIVHDKDQNTTDFQSVGLSGLSGRFTKTLTESVATSVVIIPVPAATSVSGQLLYTVHARDGTNSQTRSGRILFSGVAEGTTATCVIGTAEELDNTPTGTLTAAITCTSPANNQIQLLIDAASSLTQTTLEAYNTVILVGAGEPLPQ